eukprot:jgi/Chlat1/275/Chrsp1S03167
MSTPGEWYRSLPPICRIWGSLCAGTTIACQFGLMDPRKLVLSFPLVFRKFHIWRLLTNFHFLGLFGIGFVMNLIFIIQYGCHVERHTFEGRTADFLFMLMFGMACMLGVAYVVPGLSVMSTSLVFMVLYLWSRFNANQSVSIWGVFRLQAFYLPWALMVLAVMMGGSPIPDLLGIVVGHLYYFLTVLHPRNTGKNYLATPAFVHRLLAQAGIGEVDRRYVPPAGSGRVFQGRGQRLGTS